MRDRRDLSRRIGKGAASLGLAFALAAGGGTARARHEAPPRSFSASVRGWEQVDKLVLPHVDEDAYLLEDAARAEAGIDSPLRFAAAHHVGIDPGGRGTWEQIDGGRLWRLQVVSEGARSLNFGFTRYRLPPGATLHFYPTAPGFSGPGEYDGPYDSRDNVHENELWTPIVPGDAVMIELFVPQEVAFEPELFLAQVDHAYRDFGREAARQGSCNNDVICPEGDPWRDQIRSVAVYQRSGQWMCTGELVNTVGVFPPPAYFLTARHCGISLSNDQTVRIYWNFESPHCGDLCCGSLAQNQQGTTWRAQSSPSDFCLVELTDYPLAEFNVYFTGWDARESWRPQSSTAIHHPNTDEKAITFNYDPITVTSYLGTSVPGDGTHWRIDNWEDGTTEPGSSGSGLWDDNRHLVGQLHGGYASCSSITSDWFGRFSRSWTGGGSASSALRFWLDPGDTGAMVADGVDPDDPSSVESPPVAGGARPGVARIYPNPASGEFSVSFSLDRPAAVGFDLIDASGRVVRNHQAGSFSSGSGQTALGDQTLAPGVYFLRMRVDGRTADTEKLVVIH
jgi:lysyl endopeptidase